MGGLKRQGGAGKINNVALCREQNDLVLVGGRLG